MFNYLNRKFLVFVLLVICVFTKSFKCQMENEIGYIEKIKRDIRILDEFTMKHKYQDLIDKLEVELNKLNLTDTSNTQQQQNFQTKRAYCHDPIASVLDEQLYRFNVQIKDFIGFMDLSHIREQFKEYLDDSRAHIMQESYFGSRECDVLSRNITEKLNEIAVCPWHYVYHQRTDRYPSRVLHAACNCETCLGYNQKRFPFTGEKFNHKCTPITKLSPALQRTETCVNNVFIWKPILEKLSTGCVCSRDNIKVYIPGK
jgi:hypothetical protein